MADEDLAIAPTDQADPAVEIETPELPQTILDPGEEPDPDGDSSETETDPAEEVEDYELDGKKYTIPKALKPFLMKDADYTQKSQKNAEFAKTLEARESGIEERLKATDDELDARATVRSLDGKIAEYAKLTAADWQHYSDQDPLATENAWRTYQLLKEQRSEAAKTLEGRQNERTQTAQQDFAKRVEQTLAFAKEKIPNWSTDHVRKMTEFALSQGIPEQAIKTNWSPQFYALLHKASIGDQVEKQQSAPKPAPKPPVAPLVTVKATSSPAPSRSLADLAKGDDMEAYAAARKSGRVR